MRRQSLLLVALLSGILAFMTFRSAAADEAADPDGCSLATLGEVQSLITPKNVEIRSRSGNPAPGESTCTWMAYEPGLTADAPADGSLSLSFYHFANAAKAAQQTRRLSKDTPPPPSLVRTDDPQDQIIRPNGSTVIARHGTDITVVDAGEAQEAAREEAHWNYRLEVLALKAAGGKLLGPVNDRATADTCHLLPPGHILALLTLSPSTLKESLDGKRCFFSVEDGSGTNGAWVNNSGNAELTREDLGFNAAALKFQHDQTPFYPASELVATADPTDRVVLDPKNPGMVWAVHGPYYVTLSLADVTSAASGHPSWAYRVQRAALEAAGATIVPKTGIAADPAVPRPALLDRVTETGSESPAAWTPEPHIAPPDAGVIDPILHVFAVLEQFRFFVLPALIGIPVLFSTWRSSRAQSRGKKSHVGWWIIPLGVVCGVIIFLFGTSIMTTLIYQYGVAGSAVVTGTYDTGSQYNNHDIFGHRVLIRTADQQVISTSFESDDFNVYPPHNETIYPGKGDVFTVRYLSHFPSDFVIVADDGSPWATSLRCGHMRSVAENAQSQVNFAPDNLAYRKAFEDAVHAQRAAGCG
jgi:hypothetical protein